MNGVQPEVVDFIFEQGTSATARQLRDADALDAKVTQVFGAATVIIGLAGFGHKPNAPLLAAAVFVYLAASVAAGFALWLVKFRVADSPAQLLERYWNEPLEKTKYALVTDMAAGFGENEQTLRRKRRSVLVALTLAGVETALVGAAAIWTLLA